MSWYDDPRGEFDRDPDYCRYCRRKDVDYEACKSCQKIHNEMSRRRKY